MAKDKKKKKNKYGDTADEFMREYNESLELLKAKHEQLDGLIREANLFLQEIKDIRDNLKRKTEPTLDD
jgi:hypothetical protein